MTSMLAAKDVLTRETMHVTVPAIEMGGIPHRLTRLDVAIPNTIHKP